MKAMTAACAAALALAALLTDAAPGSAQPQPQFRPRVQVSAWGGGYTNFGGFSHPGTQDFFNFGSDFAYGGGLHVRLSPELMVGLDAGYGITRFQRNEIGNPNPVATGDAKVGSAFLSARMNTGGSGPLGLYLTGGIGAFAYDLPQPEFDGWDPDFALTAGAGLQYNFRPRIGLYLEYGQIWAYHQKEGGSNTAKHNLLRLGTRFGL
jgi:opacity protein-like surface antigen